MCFSNLPVEFDDRGNPYLADEADDVQRTHRTDGDDAPLDEDPEGAYAAILDDAPDSLHSALAGTDRGERAGRGTDGGSSARDDRGGTAGGD